MRDLRVLDLSQTVAGAYCARLFAAAGAHVTLVEPTGGSRLRTAPPLLSTTKPPRSAAFEYLSAWKRGIALSTNTPEGETVLDSLLDHADLVVSSLTDTPQKILDFDRRIRSDRPALIHVVASSYGLSGPWSGWRSSDLTDWAVSGYLYITGDPQREPLQGAGPWASYVAGTTAAVGAMAALHHRRQTGRGQLVDVGAMESMAAAHQWSLVMWSHQGVVKHRANNRHAEAHHPVSLMPCADGWVCIGAPSQAQWINLCIALDLPEMAHNPRYSTSGRRYDLAEEIDASFAPFLMARTRSEVVNHLQAHHVPASAVLALDETLRDEQLEARAYWVYPEDLGSGAQMPGLPFLMPSSPLEFKPAPKLGADTAAVLTECGFSEQELIALEQAGLIGVGRA